MSRYVRIVFALLLIVTPVRAQYEQLIAKDPALAEVRIKSHGCSGTVIATSHGRSWILSCGHAYLDHNENPSPALRAKKHFIDGPSQPYAIAKTAPGPARLVAWDHDADLSLLILDNGPFYHVPVAPPGHRPRHVQSLGYDRMDWPVTQKPATLTTGPADGVTYTVEHPIPGRSGGGLIDLDSSRLIGTCIGYELIGVSQRPGRGMYVAHQRILAFLQRNRQFFVIAWTDKSPQIDPFRGHLFWAPPPYYTQPQPVFQVPQLESPPCRT